MTSRLQTVKKDQVDINTSTYQKGSFEENSEEEKATILYAITSKTLYVTQNPVLGGISI